MRRFIVGIAGLTFMMASYCAAQSPKTFTGEITLNPDSRDHQDAYIL